MVTVTDAAKEELGRILSTRSLDPGKCLRLAIPPTWEGPGDFGIVVDVEGDGDHTVELDGLKLLLMDPLLTERLIDSVLDFKDTPGSSGFTLDVF
ncbi:hypothetical protein FIM08_02540 [SAR202 cluster bacterium AC-647-N09_OGT_505m]|nr:hypothetical protein [SAR202 cluster bacterium AC-647-N09_OGT_505m]